MPELRAAASAALIIFSLACNSQKGSDAVVKQELSSASELPGADGEPPSQLKTNQSSALVIPHTVPAPATSTGPKAVLPIIPKTVTVDPQAPIGEKLGPCSGRGSVVGSMTIEGKTEYVCGDGSRQYYQYPYGYGSRPSNRNNYPSRPPRTNSYYY